MNSDESSSISSGTVFEEGYPRLPSPLRSLDDSYDSSLLRLAVRKGARRESSIHQLLLAVSRFGEVQSIDVSRLQFDSTFTVSYFDVRAASFARTSLRTGSVQSLQLADSKNRCSSFIERFEDVHHSCSAAGRCVDVCGFPTWDSRYKDLLLSVFSKFGEIESITHNSTDQYRVAFFDSRTPLAIQSVLHPNIDNPDHVKITSEELVPLLLAGTTLDDVEAEVPLPTPQTPSKTEFMIDVSRLESGAETRTTVMIRNIPRSFNKKTVSEIISKRFGKDRPVFDFLYLPMDLINRLNVGYLFINFVSTKFVSQCVRLFHGKTWRLIAEATGVTEHGNEDMGKVSRVTFARLQGKESLMEHFSKSSVMHNQPASMRPLFL